MNHDRALVKPRTRRAWRVRKNIRGTAQRPRLSVFRSHKHVYAQLIDDQQGRTLAAASTAVTLISSSHYDPPSMTYSSGPGQAVTFTATVSVSMPPP